MVCFHPRQAACFPSVTRFLQRDGELSVSLCRGIAMVTSVIELHVFLPPSKKVTPSTIVVEGVA